MGQMDTTVPRGGGNRARLDDARLKRFINAKLIDAISHPVRAHVLTVLNERVSSPNKVAKEIGVDVNYVSYHFRELKDRGFIELVRTEPRRGATEHYYRAKAPLMFDDREWEQLPVSIKPTMSADLLRWILADAVAALKAGTFDAGANKHMSRIPLLVDEQGWKELSAALNEALERVLAIESASAKRLAETDREAIPAMVAMMNFGTPAGPA